MTRRVPTLAELPEAVSEALTALADDAKPGPFGRKSLSQLVAGHLPVFADLKRLGGPWSAIVGLLTECGIIDGDDGLDADVLRATYSRAKRAARTRRNKPKQSGTPRDITKRNEPKRAEPRPAEAERVQPLRSASQRSEAKHGEAQRERGREPTGVAASTDTVKPDASAPELPHADPFKPSAVDADDFFRRAALTLKPLRLR